MRKFIIGTFLLLGFGFYELSGGSEFTPEARPVVVADVTTTTLEPVVTRSDNTALLTLASVEDVTPVAPVVASVITPDPVQIPALERVEAAPVEETTPTTRDLRTVAGSRVNMRAGPGTNFGVVDSLVQGTWTEVLEVDTSGWARIRDVDTGQEGWMAERFLQS